MTQDNRDYDWGPRFLCSVPTEAKPVSAPSVERLDETELAAVKRVVAERTRSPSAIHLGKAIAILARQESTTEISGLLGAVLGDPSVPPVDRAVAAVELGRMPPSEAESVLVRHLDAPESVAVRVVQSLGAIGGADALSALQQLTEPDSRALRRQVLFARRLIGYRVGLENLEPEELRGSRWDLEQDEQVRDLTVRPLNAEEIGASSRGLGGRIYGIELADNIGFAIGDVSRTWHLLFNRAVVGAAGLALIRDRPAIAALVTVADDRTGTGAVHQIVLTAPRNEELLVHGYRTDGVLLFDGSGPLRDEEVSFAVTSADRRGRCLFRIVGRLFADGPAWDQHEASSRRRNKQQALTVE